MLKPFDGGLECYPVSKEVGKVGNNSPVFIVPVASTENKHNIANFFSNAKKSAKGTEEKEEIKEEDMEVKEKGSVVQHDSGEKRATIEKIGTENNAPLPIPATASKSPGPKRECEVGEDDKPPAKAVKTEAQATPTKPLDKTPSKKTRSATSNGTLKGRVVKGNGSQKITNFFK